MTPSSSGQFLPSTFKDTHHRLTEKDVLERRAVCSQCGPVKMLSAAAANTTWRCANKYNQRRRGNGYRRHLGDHCPRCGFEPEIDPVTKQPLTCQLDVDHIDNDHHNNAVENLATICSNCHRVKSYWTALGRGDEFSMERVKTRRRRQCPEDPSAPS